MYLDNSSCVIPEVWKIIDEKMNKEKKEELCESLKLSEKLSPKSHTKLRVPWSKLKEELYFLDEKEVIKEIQNTTYITRGMT